MNNNICKKCHKKFHDIYGRGNNTEEQLDDRIMNEILILDK